MFCRVVAPAIGGREVSVYFVGMTDAVILSGPGVFGTTENSTAVGTATSMEKARCDGRRETAGDIATMPSLPSSMVVHVPSGMAMVFWLIEVVILGTEMGCSRYGST